jgi:hypothetical protein
LFAFYYFNPICTLYLKTHSGLPFKDDVKSKDVTQVPFEFEASGGLVILGGLFLARRLKARKKDNNVA